MYNRDLKQWWGKANRWGPMLLAAIIAMTFTSCANANKESVTITGIFTTVWNDEPHYSITDDAGNRYKVLLEEETAKSIGGPLQADRKRVVLTGYFVDETKAVFQVTSIELAEP